MTLRSRQLLSSCWKDTAKSCGILARVDGTRNWRRGGKNTRIKYIYIYIHGPKVQGGRRRRRCLPQRGFAFEGRNHPAKPPWFLEINSSSPLPPPPPPHIMSPGIIRKTDRDQAAAVCIEAVVYTGKRTNTLDTYWRWFMDVLLTLSRWIFFFPPFYATVNIAPIKKKGRKEGIWGFNWKLKGRELWD